MAARSREGCTTANVEQAFPRLANCRTAPAHMYGLSELLQSLGNLEPQTLVGEQVALEHTTVVGMAANLWSCGVATRSNTACSRCMTPLHWVSETFATNVASLARRILEQRA